MSLLKPLKNEWTLHRSRAIQEIYRDARLYAVCGHPRDDCPHRGDVPPLKGQGQWRRTPAMRAMLTLRRRAWLAGWDDQTALMQKAAENESRRPVIDEDDV